MQANVKLVLAVSTLIGRVIPICIKTTTNNEQFRQRTVLARGMGTMINDDWLLGVHNIVKECLLRRKCIGISYPEYSSPLRTFDMFANDTSLDNSLQDMYDIQQLSAVMVGTCASRPCPVTAKCIPTTPTYRCVPFCDVLDLPSVRNATRIETGGDPPAGVPGGWVQKLVLHCDPTYIPTPASLRVTCQEETGTWWPHYPSFECVEIRTCEQIQQCNSTYSDGMYVVHREGHLKVVNCTNMASHTPVTSNIHIVHLLDAVPIAPSCGEEDLQ